MGGELCFFSVGVVFEVWIFSPESTLCRSTMSTKLRYIFLVKSAYKSMVTRLGDSRCGLLSDPGAPGGPNPLLDPPETPVVHACTRNYAYICS
jgi:hypothetical protein